MKKIVSLFALIILIGAGCSSISNSDISKEIENKEEVKNITLNLAPQGSGYLNTKSVLDKYKEQDLLEYRNEDEKFSFKYPKSFANVNINNFPGGTVFYGWTVTDDGKDSIVVESIITDLKKDSSRSKYGKYGPEFAIDYLRNERINSDYSKWSETEVIEDVYEIKTSEFSGYAFDDTRDRGQHVGLPIVRTTATYFVFTNKRGDLYRFNLIANADAKVIFETLKFEE